MSETQALLRSYAHFQRLMTQLMWECLTGEEMTGAGGCRVRWLEQEGDGPLTHDLHLPQGVEGERNRYAKAFYVLLEPALREEVRARLAELAALREEILVATGSSERKLRRNLAPPSLYEGVREVHYRPLQAHSSHLKEREEVLASLKGYLEDYKRVTRERYEGAGEDAVLLARYEEIRRLEADALRLAESSAETVRVRSPYLRVRPYLTFEDGSSLQVYLPDVGMIFDGQPELIDDSPRSRKSRRTVAPEVLATFRGEKVYDAEAWDDAVFGGSTRAAP